MASKLAEQLLPVRVEERSGISQALLSGVTVSPAAERLRYILSEDDDLPTPTLFTEMDTLQREGDELEWKESARWVTPTLSHTTNEQQLCLAGVYL